MQKILRRTQTTWNKLLKPSINAAFPFRGLTVAAESKNPKAGQASTFFLKSILMDEN